MDAGTFWHIFELLVMWTRTEDCSTRVIIPTPSAVVYRCGGVRLLVTTNSRALNWRELLKIEPISLVPPMSAPQLLRVPSTSLLNRSKSGSRLP